MALSKEQFLKPRSVQVIEVPVPELGEGATVFMRGCTGRERTEFEASFRTKSGKTHIGRMKEIRERVIIYCLCNETGTRLLSEEDVDQVGKLPAKVVERLVEIGQSLMGMSDTDVESIVGN